MHTVINTRTFFTLALTAFLFLFAGPACADVDFSVYASGTTNNELSVLAGQEFFIDIVMSNIQPETGVNGEVDGFTYRVAFSSETFTLTSNEFGAPFDNTLVGDGGLNDSTPWHTGGSDILIDNNADAGSFLSTPFIADLYRATVTELGVPPTDDPFVVETIGLLAPGAIGSYTIDINVSEAFDTLASPHINISEGSLNLNVFVPAPAAAIAFLLGLAGLAVRYARKDQ